MARVLLVDDDESFANATSEILTLLGHSVDLADSVRSASELLATRIYERVFLDLMLPDGSGLHLLEYVPEQTKVTLMTGHPSVKSQVMSLYGMNINYLVKPIELKQLKRLFDDSENETKTHRENYHFGELIGESAAMLDLYKMIERVASTSANVLLMGESGVGKEVFARAIHNASGCQGALVASNCGAFSAELIGSELFGHEKGAFTGAVARKIGVFEQAMEGTLFLDEITEMPMDLQTVLLRVLESRQLTRVGGTDLIPVNCRIISATNRSEEDIAGSKALREDIYYRLAVFPMHIPSLRERIDDIPLLVSSFISTLNCENNTTFRVSDSDMKRLMQYDWPGNIRELRHVIHRCFIMTDPESQLLTFPESFSSPFSRQKNEVDSQVGLVGNTIEDVEKKLIMGTLASVANNKTQAAEILGVSVKTLYNRLNTYKDELDGADFTDAVEKEDV